MPLNRRCCIEGALLLLAFLTVASLVDPDPDASEDDVKGNQARACMRILDCFGIKHGGEYKGITCNCHIQQDIHGIQDPILASPNQNFLDVKLQSCQRIPSLQESLNLGKVVSTGDYRFQGLLQPSVMTRASYRAQAPNPFQGVPESSELLMDHSPFVNSVQKSISGFISVAPFAVPNDAMQLPTEFIEACLQIITVWCSSGPNKGHSFCQSDVPQPFSTPVHRLLSHLPVDDVSLRTSKRAFQHSFFYSPLPITLRDTKSLDSSLQEQSPNLSFRAMMPSAVSLQHLSALSAEGQAPTFEMIQPPSYSPNTTAINLKQHPHRHHHKCHPSLSPAPSIDRSSSSVSTSHFCHHKHHRIRNQESPGRAPAPAPLFGPASLVSRPPTAVASLPPNQGCAGVSCSVPYTETPFGSPCGCVIPMQVRLELGVALYALFPLTSVLAEELAYGTLLSQNQVRITGANAEKQDEDKSVVDIDLVPLDEAFDNLTALLIFEKFHNHEIYINETLFGSCEVLYVNYPGLPPSAYPGQPPEGNSYHPIGADIRNNNNKLHSGTIALIALSSSIVVIICMATAWLVIIKFSQHAGKFPVVESVKTYSIAKRSGGRSMLSSDIVSSTSMSFASSIVTYTGPAKTLTLAELERATEKFKPENIVGEGGFGRVYCGVLDDGTKVAVKVLTRDEQHGGQEFISEVEMLSRLHHRNLVKLIGVCTDERCHSLVYELIPNGSVESHLHGTDKLTSPLNWDTRMKIALGAARGLAYLHEDSNPRVIHRDFKASNILLEDDFTPKISDFGLAKAAPDEGSGHISTRVMGTFGYVAPEYAMTGHLLVKSDVYSYGVVLLELLTGRKPVDMCQPPGQENLVTWARPLLTSQDSLEVLVDPALGNNVPTDNIARVAAIASMCVQPEVSHRPFMGEVVQALKLVYNDSDTINDIGSGNGSQGGQSPSHDSGVRPQKPWEGGTIQFIHDSASFFSADYSDMIHRHNIVTERPFSASAILSRSQKFLRELSGWPFRRHSTSGPLRIHRIQSLWSRVRSTAPRSMSENVLNRHFGTGLEREFHELWP